jgi:O-antigen/teichoic acid export membrane protein
VLALMFSPVIVGFYSMAYLVVRLPSKVIGNSIATVFFQKASVEKNFTGSIQNVVKSVNSRLISIGMFACLVLMIIGPELFKVVLGAQWITAGVYAQIFAPWFFVAFISTPLVSVFNVLEKQHVRMWFNVLLLISDIIVLYIGGLSGNPIIGMLLLSGTGVCFYMWMNLYSLRISGVSVRDAIREILRYLALGLLVCLPLLIAKYFSIPSILLLVVAIIVSIIYYLIIVQQDTLLKEGIINSFKNIVQK